MDLGVEGGSPRIIFEAAGNPNVWQVDNLSGLFRWFIPGSLKMSLSSAGVLAVATSITQSGIKVPSVIPIPLHAGGSVPAGLLKPKFLAN